MNAQDEVLFEEVVGKGGHLGVITLNRPAVLNSLNHSMVLSIHRQLQHWATVDHVKAVVIRAAAGRAFCAGGDLRSAYERWQTNDPELTGFFRDEYQLNRFIHHFPKPYIALLDGITMGGGVGLSIHGSHRVASERLMFAMPETAIGFFPDVGGTYFLPRLPGKIGLHLGLTGHRIGVADAFALGLVTHHVASDHINGLVDELALTVFGANAKKSVSDVIKHHAAKTDASTLLNEQSVIDSCYAFDEMESIIQALEASQTSLAKEALAALSKKSPTSLKVSLQACLEGKSLNFDDCMRQEFRLTCHFLANHDFLEGIRALIIDKDQSPSWQPAKLAEVSCQEVKKYFLPLTQELA